MAKKVYNSMNDFAAVCGISRPTLSKYFNDPTTVKEVTRKRIEQALKTLIGHQLHPYFTWVIKYLFTRQLLSLVDAALYGCITMGK